MIKPQDITAPTAAISHSDVFQRFEIERHFDRAIAAAQVNGQWPARAMVSRSGWSEKNVLAVVEAYANAGWVIGSAPDCYATFRLA